MRKDLIEKHGNKCALCMKPREMFKMNLAVDHSHTSGKIRGLLCYHCNRFQVGRLTLKKAIPIFEYLIKYEGGEELCQKYGKMLLDLKENIK